MTVRSRTRTPAAPNLTAADVKALSEALNEPQWMRERRLQAWTLYESLPMPSSQDEAWRRTDYRRIKWQQAGQLLLPGQDVDTRVIPAYHSEPLLGDKPGGLLTFIDSSLAQNEVAEELTAQGVIFTDMHTAVRDHGDLLQEHFMTTVVKPEDGKFAALHAALWTHGVFLYVPRGKVVEVPLHSVFYNTSAGMTLGHVLIVAEEGSQVTFMHEYGSPTLEEQQAYIGATEIIAGAAANVQYVALQDWGRSMYEFSHKRARVARDGNLDWVAGSMGSKFLKTFMEIDLDEAGASGRLSGLYFADTKQFMDHDTQQNHNAPNTTSDLLFKGALTDTARSVWQGMIYVDPIAQHTDGFQANRNLMLSKNCRADSIPGLEIMADDVRCTHAATLSQLEEEPIYYLMSRGIPREEASLLAVNGFFGEVMQRVPFEGVRDRLQTAIEAKLQH